MAGLDDRVHVAAGIVAAVALLVYARTLLPGIAFGDWGEMQVQPTVLGIAHPTGYPSYILLASLAELIPLGSVAFRSNLLSAVFVSLALATAALIGIRLGVRPAVAAAAALALGGVGTIWAAATVAEVNPLHLLFAALLFHRALVWAERRAVRDLVLGGLLLGLAFGNHLLTVTIAPFIVAFVVWAGRRELLARPWLLGVAVASLALGLAVYLYIPIRAVQNPPLAYNHPVTLDGVVWLVTGTQFRGQFDFFSPRGPGQFVAALPSVAALLSARATPLLPILGVTGLAVLVRRRPAVAVLLIGVLLGGIYAYANYLRLEHYLLVPWLVLGIGAAVALERLALALDGAFASAGARVRSRAAPRIPTRGIVAAATVCFAVALAVANGPAADRSRDRSGDEYVAAVVAALPRDAVILSEWDVSTPLWYAQLVERRRADVLVIDDSNIVYDGWGTRESAIAAFVCERPVFILRLDDASLAPARSAFLVDPFITVRVGVGGPTAVATRTIYRVRPAPGHACPP